MDIISMGIAGVAAITVICYLVGEIVKATNLDNKWIPIVCMVAGAALGPLALWMGLADFPAGDYLTAVAVGIVSGLAATGADQIGKQLRQ